MYNLPYFKEKDQQRVLEFVKAHPFAFLSGCDADNKPVATQIPVFIEERDGKLFLSGHMMKNTDHHKAFEHNPTVLAVFTGAHTYVSASLYSNQQEASTWNYMSVHAKGKLRFVSEAELMEVLKHTTNHFENNPHSPSNFENLPKEYVEKLAKAIVAFEVEIESIDNVFKLSQNRNEKSYENIMEHLQQKDADAKTIATEMQLRKEELFK